MKCEVNEYSSRVCDKGTKGCLIDHINNTVVYMTAKESSELSPETKIEILKGSKPGTWYDGWQPYCMMCSTMARMDKKDYGFKCSFCENMIGFDLYRLAESPLNRR